VSSPTNDTKEAHLRQIRGFVHDYAKSCLQISILLNGGALVALLAFAGSIISMDQGTVETERLSIIIFVFVGGLMLAVTAHLSTLQFFIRQHNVALSELGHNLASAEEERNEDTTKLRQSKTPWKANLIITIVLTIFSYFLFAFGAGASHSWIFKQALSSVVSGCE